MTQRLCHPAADFQPSATQAEQISQILKSNWKPEASSNTEMAKQNSSAAGHGPRPASTQTPPCRARTVKFRRYGISKGRAGAPAGLLQPASCTASRLYDCSSLQPPEVSHGTTSPVKSTAACLLSLHTILRGAQGTATQPQTTRNGRGSRPQTTTDHTAISHL